MGRPRRNAQEINAMELLDADNVYRAIKQHSLVKQYNLTIPEIKSIFDAYSDIVLNTAQHNIRIELPKIGEFYPQDMKGWQGGEVLIPKTEGRQISKGMEYEKKYYPPKPDYKLLQFGFKNYVKERFKRLTEAME